MGNAVAAPAAAAGKVLAVTVYAPLAQTVLTAGTVTMAAFASGVVCTGPFTAPPSGNVLVRFDCMMAASAGSAFAAFGLAAAGTVSPLVAPVSTVAFTSSAEGPLQTIIFEVTGLTPGQSYNFDLLGASNAVTATTSIYAYAQTATSPNLAGTGRGAPVIATVTQL